MIVLFYLFISTLLSSAMLKYSVSLKSLLLKKITLERKTSLAIEHSMQYHCDFPFMLALSKRVNCALY